MLPDVIYCHFETMPCKQTKKTISVQFYNKMYWQKDVIRYVFVRIAAAVDTIKNMADCRLSRFNRRIKVSVLLLIFEYWLRYKVNKYPMTENKPIYHAWNVNPWKGLGEITTFHRFANLRRDIAVYFWSWGTYLLWNYKTEIFALLIWISNISICQKFNPDIQC